MLVDCGDAIWVLGGASERGTWTARDAFGLMRPVGQDLSHVGQRAHDWPFAGARLAIQNVGWEPLDLGERPLNARFQALDSLFGGHDASVARPIGTPPRHCLH